MKSIRNAKGGHPEAPWFFGPASAVMYRINFNKLILKKEFTILISFVW